VDGVLLNTDGMRVLLVGETTATLNGIYLVHSGAWTRSTDLAAASNAAGAYAFVAGGTTYGSSGWICSNAAGSDVVGTNNLTFSLFTMAGQVTVGNGLTKTGQRIDVVASDGTLVVTAGSMRVGTIGDANITDVGWNKLTGLPSITTTAPLTGGGVIGAGLTLAISAASSSAAGSMSAAHWSKLDGMTISGTMGSLSKFTGASALGNSVVADLGLGTAISIGAGYHGHAFTIAGGYKHITLGTSYFDGSNYITPGVGTNAISEIVTDISGIAFIVLPSAASSTRTDAPANFLSWERFRVNGSGAVVSGTLQITGGTPGLGKLLTSDAAGNATWSSSLTGVTGLLFDPSATLYQIKQSDSTTGNGNTLGIIAQSTAVSNCIGGTLQLRGGVGGNPNSGTVGVGGTVDIWAGNSVVCEFGTDKIRPRINALSFYSGLSGPAINQEVNGVASATGKTFNLTAQSCSGTGSTGGDLLLGSGSGGSAPGHVGLVVGGYEMLAAIYNKGLRVSSYAGGEVTIHMVNSSSINPTLLDAGGLFVWSGALYYKGSSGTVTRIANA
jgi:hypothetical protein